jgi:hypothetical protein
VEGDVMSAGYIYVLSNSAMPGLLKIGITNRDVKERVGELSAASGVPKPFEIEYYCLTSDMEEIEKQIHEHFSSVRVSGKEFFSVAIVKAVEVIDSLIRMERFYKNEAKKRDDKGWRPQNNQDIDLDKVTINEVAKMLVDVNSGKLGVQDLPRNVAIVRRVLAVTNNLAQAIAIVRGW